MRLMAATDFALRTLMFLADDPDRLFNTDELAQTLQISRNHLQKVVQALVAGNFVRTIKGARGGVLLAHPAADIRVGAVVRWFEEKQPIVECFQPDGGNCTLRPRCGLKHALSGAQEQYFSYLEDFTIADCLRPPMALARKKISHTA